MRPQSIVWSGGRHVEGRATALMGGVRMNKDSEARICKTPEDEPPVLMNRKARRELARFLARGGPKKRCKRKR